MHGTGRVKISKKDSINISLLVFSCFSCFLLDVCEVFVDPTVAVVVIVETGISASRISSMNFVEICSDS